VKVGDRSHRKRWTFACLVAAFCNSAREILNKLRQRSLRLPDKDVIRIRQILDRGGDVWTTQHYAFPMRLASFHDLLERIFLHQHRRGKYHVRPFNVGGL
jgi:hypothetical protein